MNETSAALLINELSMGGEHQGKQAFWLQWRPRGFWHSGAAIAGRPAYTVSPKKKKTLAKSYIKSTRSCLNNFNSLGEGKRKNRFIIES